MPEEEFDAVKVFESNLNLSNSISDYLEIKFYKKENGEELDSFEFAPFGSKIFLISDYTSNSLFIKNLPYLDNSEFPIATLKKGTGDFYIDGISNSLQKTIKNNELATASALVDLNDKVGGVTSYDDLTDKPTILNNYDVANITKENSLLQYDNSNNYVFAINYGYSAQSINTIENSESSLILGKYNHLSNANRGVMLGLNNNAIGDKSDSYDYTITIGYQNNNNNNQTVVIGAYLYNTKQYSIAIGTNNTNNSTNGINIGRFNYNSSVVDNNISIGYDNSIYKDIDGIVIGN